MRTPSDSPATKMPWHMRHRIKIKPAPHPKVSCPGKMPTTKVGKEMPIMLYLREMRRPRVSPSCPKIKAPRGFDKDPTAKTPKVFNRDVVGSSLGKKWSARMGAKNP